MEAIRFETDYRCAVTFVKRQDIVRERFGFHKGVGHVKDMHRQSARGGCCNTAHGPNQLRRLARNRRAYQDNNWIPYLLFSVPVAIVYFLT